MLSTLNKTIDNLSFDQLTEDRKEILQVLIDYVQSKIDKGHSINLNFICTHNSRRSQFSQIWAQTASHYFGIETYCMSGGVEVTAFNERAVASAKRLGFVIESVGVENPKYTVAYAEGKSLVCFSKLFDDEVNKVEGFAAVMTCSHADENCPFIPGTEARIPVRFEDPKAFDDTPKEAEMYDARSLQIAAEMFYVFSQIKK